MVVDGTSIPPVTGSMVVTMVAALDFNGAIGREGKIPWKLSADLKRFRELTTGRPIIMGRKTHESIGVALPKRTNIVVTRNAEYSKPGIKTALSLESALALAAEETPTEVAIIGGGEIYEQALPLAHRLYLTLVHTKIEEADAHFPQLNLWSWKLCRMEEVGSDEKNEYPSTLLVFNRVLSSSAEGHKDPAFFVDWEPYLAHVRQHWTLGA